MKATIKVKVRPQVRSYNIYVGANIIVNAGYLLQRLTIGKDALIVSNSFLRKNLSDKLVSSLKSRGISTKFIEVPDSEKAKSIRYAWDLVERIARLDIRKHLFLVAFGGGVIGDLTGFVAAIYKRGIPYIQIPTTLLAQVDSSIGGKTAIDLAAGKNLCGAFYQPALVISDTDFLKTLSPKQVRAGLSEVVKYGLILNKSLFCLIEKEYPKILSCQKGIMERVIKRCAELKAGIVSRDEREEKGLRTILNFGHTVAHAIEKAGGYRLYGHGEAVALGMIAEAKISEKLGMLDRKEYERIVSLIQRMKLSGRMKALNTESIMQAQLYDKKFRGQINRFVLLKGIGSAVVRENIPHRIIRQALEELKKI